MSRVRVLGQPSVVVGRDATPVNGLAGRILCRLVTTRPHPLSIDRLTDSLWGDSPPASSRSAVQVAVHRLRSLLEPDRPKGTDPTTLRSGSDGYWLDVANVTIDTAEFQQAVTSGQAMMQRGDWAAASALIEQALEAWGQPFGDFGSEHDLLAERQRLEELHRAAEEQLSEARLELRTHSVARLRRLAEAEPLRERRWEHLMLGLYRDARQTEALRAYAAATAALAEVGLRPGPRLREVEAAILAEGRGLLDDRAANRPPLFGRQGELTELQTAAQPGAVVSLVGLPGIGKTALAEAFAQTALSAGRQTTIVRIADEPETDPTEILADTILVRAPGPLGRDETIALIATTFDNDAILVLDGVTDIDGWKPTVRQLLDECPQLTVLITGRSSLGVDGETVLQIGPISIGETDDDPWGVPAVQLFAVSCSAATAPAKSEGQLLLQIVRAVGGHPLAIEMAAALHETLQLKEVLQLVSRPDERAALSPELDSAISAVVDTLDKADREVLELACRLKGRWTAEDLTAIAQSTHSNAQAVPSAVAELARRSLVHKGVHDTFWTLPSVRSVVGVHRDERMRDAIAELADFLDAGLRTADQVEVLRRFDGLAPDIEAALGEAHAAGDIEVSWRIFGSLGHYWWLKQSRAHSIQWRNRVIDLARVGDVKPGIAARALFVAGASGFAFMRFADNQEYLETASEIADLAEPADSALIHAGMALALAFASFGNLDASEAGRRAVATAEASRDPFAISFSYMALALATGSTFDFAGAVRLGDRAVGAADESGASSLQALTRTMLGHLHQYLSDFDRALEAYTGVFWDELPNDYTWLTLGARYGAAEAAQLLGDVDTAFDDYQACLDGMRRAGDARGAILASVRIGVIAAERNELGVADRHIGFATTHLRFHDEDALRAGVLLARAYVEALAGNYQTARSDLAQAEIHIAGAGSPLGPIDTGLHSKVEAAVASATD